MGDGSHDCFVVFVRHALGPTWQPAVVEQPVAACPTYEEAVSTRERFRRLGRNCVIRCVGQTGGGD